MQLRGFEIKPIKNEQTFFAAENFVEQLDPHTLNGEEKNMFSILLELMEHYDKNNIVPKYYFTPQELIQFLLEEKGYSQVDLAKFLEVKQPNISEILKGTRDLSKTLMKKIHTKFKIPYETMF